MTAICLVLAGCGTFASKSDDSTIPDSVRNRPAGKLAVEKVRPVNTGTTRGTLEYQHVFALGAIPDNGYWTDADHAALKAAIAAQRAELKRQAEIRERDLSEARAKAARAALIAAMKTNADATVYFAYASDALGVQAKEGLDRLVAELKANAIEQISVVGHTDAIGSEEANVQLGRRRAEAVREYLIQLGYEASKILLDSKGKDNPAQPNESLDGRAHNRRVELQITAVGAGVVIEEQEVARDPNVPASLQKDIPIVVGQDGAARPSTTSPKPAGGVTVLTPGVQPATNEPRRPQVIVVKPEPATEDDYRLLQKYFKPEKR